MSEPSSDRNPVEELAEEFLERFRHGERPSLTEYTRRYPALASDIRDLFPALVMLEDVRPAAAASDDEAEDISGSLRPQKLERLGDYRILREVGRGGMGIVYEAEQESLGRHVALKVLSTHALLDSRQLQRFQREARSAARLHHTNIVPVFGVGEHDNLHYYVMQFIHGQGLDQVLEELKLLRLRAGRDVGDLSANDTARERLTPDAAPQASSALVVARCLVTGVFAKGEAREGSGEDGDRRSARNETPHPSSVATSATPASGVHLLGQGEKSALSDSGRLYWDSVARIGIQVADALTHAHGQGTLHRDIKPSNLLLDTQGVVWVTDFGLAKGSDSEDLTHPGDVVGTLRYMAPERFQGKADIRSDVYALGLTLYELLTLRPAFGESERSKLLRQVMDTEPLRPRKLNPAVPRDLETIICKATARDPAHRYQTAADLAEDLKRFRDDRPIRARPVGEIERLLRWCRRNPWPASLAACLMLSLIVGIVGISWKWHEAEQRRDEAEIEKEHVIRAERETAKKRDEAVSARNDTQRVLAGAMLDKGVALAVQAEVGEGLFWMLEALKTAPPAARDLVRTIRTNLAGWRRQSQRLLHMAQTDVAGFCAFTSDGKRLLTLTRDGVECWDVATGKVLPKLLAKKGLEFHGLAFSPDGTYLAARTSNDGKPCDVELWDLANGRRAAARLFHPAYVQRAVFTPDGKLLVTGSRDGFIRVWDTGSGKLIRSFDHDKKSIWNLALSADGKMVAVVCNQMPSRQGREPNSNAVYLRELASGKRFVGPLDLGPVHRIAFAPDGATVVTAGSNGLVRLWDATTGKQVGPPLRHVHPVNVARFSPDGRTLWTGSRDGLLRCWDAVTGQQLIGPFAASRMSIDGLDASPDGSSLALVRNTSTGGGRIELWSLRRDRSRPPVKAADPHIKADWVTDPAVVWWDRSFASFSPDARQVLVGGTHGHAQVYATATGKPAYLAAPRQQSPFRNALPLVEVTAYSPDGRRFATACRPDDHRVVAGEARLWNAVDGQLVAVLPHGNYVAAISFSPDGKVLATAGYDRHVHLWDAASGKRIGPPIFQGDIVVHLAFDPDGKRLAVSRTLDYSGKNTVAVCDITDGRTVTTLPTFGGIVRFTADGKHILTSAGLSLTRWNADTGALESTMTESGDIKTLTLSPGGKLILIGGADGALRLRRLDTGALVGAPMLAGQRVNAVAFSRDPEGKFIVAGYADGTTRLWDSAMQKPLGPPLTQSHPISAVAFAPDGRSFFTTDTSGDTRAWPIPQPTTETVAQLRLLLQIDTGLEMLESQAVVPIAPAEWQRRRQAWNEERETVDEGNRSGLAPRPSSLAPLPYYDARALDAEQDGVLYTVLWHLQRAIELETRDSEKAWLYMRRGRVHAGAGQFDKADADFAQALAWIPRDQLLAWYRHCAADCQVKKNWRGVVWYLARVIAAGPVEWYLYADRAEAYEKLGHGKERDADLARAVELGADNHFLLPLVNDYASRGLWDKAKSTLAKASAQGPLPLVARHWDALFMLQADQHAKYRDLCGRLLKRIGPELPPALANAVAWLCVLAPDAAPDYAQLIKLAESAVNRAEMQERSNFLNTLGAVLYRAGRFKDAVARFEEGIRERNGQAVPQDWIFLAMAHQRLGEKEKARGFLAKVGQHQTEQRGRGWDYLELEILRREAQSMLDGVRRKQNAAKQREQASTSGSTGRDCGPTAAALRIVTRTGPGGNRGWCVSRS